MSNQVNCGEIIQKECTQFRFPDENRPMIYPCLSNKLVKQVLNEKE